MLYIVATPIGNLKDLSPRAQETLQAADFVIAENPSYSTRLFTHYQIPKKPFVQFADHNEQKVLDKLISRLKTENGALISDAGTPGISDPGFRLVRACSEAGIKVSPVPGPSAAIAALSTSGLPTNKFLFVGFLGKTEPKIFKVLEEARTTESTLIAYDSPERIKKTLGFMTKTFPTARVVVARELTKIHEEFIRGTPSEVLTELEAKPSIKGEIVLLVAFK